MKKSLFLIMSIMVLLSIISPAIANGYGYEVLEDGTICLARLPGNFNSKTYTIPSSVDDFKVSSVACAALEFIFNDKIVFSEGIEELRGGTFGFFCTVELVFPSTMKYIDKDGNVFFSEAKDLKKITVNSNNPYYGTKDNFLYNKQNNSLLYYPVASKKKSIVTPKGIEKIESSCFYKLRYVENIEVSEGVITIHHSAFSDCENLKTVKLPSTLNLDQYETIFSRCYNMASISVSKKNLSLEIVNGALYNKATHELLYLPPKAKTAKYEVPEGTEVIKAYAFSNCSNLESVHIPSSVITIEKYAFSGCSRLKNVVIDEGVSYISRSAFENCPHIPNVTYPQSAVIIDE